MSQQSLTWPALLIVWFAPTACRQAAEQAPPPTVVVADRQARPDSWKKVSTFEGTLPCASCPGIATSLQLKPDGTFLLESTYLEAEDGSDQTAVELGRWALSADESVLVLRGDGENTSRWSVPSPDTLRMLDRLGQPIDSDLPYDLIRTTERTVRTPTLALVGMYRYMADAAMFEDCTTRMKYPVVFEEAHVDLERAYLQSTPAPGQPLKVEFEGRIESRPRMEGEGERDFVVVSSFTKVDPGESCSVEPTELANTVWYLDELDGLPVRFLDSTRTPHLTLAAEDMQAAGSGGCNRFTGKYRVNGDSLGFGPLASTAMACPEGMDQEARFFDALDRTDRFSLYADVLELWTDARLLARLKAANSDHGR